jgi:hypothetical protein
MPVLVSLCLYQAVIDLGRRGHSQLAVANKVGISAGTVSRWLHAREFPERQIRSDRHRDRGRFQQQQERGVKPPASRTHYSSGRVASLLIKPESLSAEQKRHVEAFSEEQQARSPGGAGLARRFRGRVPRADIRGSCFRGDEARLESKSSGAARGAASLSSRVGEAPEVQPVARCQDGGCRRDSIHRPVTPRSLRLGSKAARRRQRNTKVNVHRRLEAIERRF